MKGPKAVEEIEISNSALEKLHLQVTSIHSYALPISAECRSLLCFNKTVSTPKCFPRRPGIPERQPL